MADSISGVNGINNVTQIDNTSKPIKEAVQDFYDNMVYLMTAMAKGTGTVTIKGATYNVDEAGTQVLANFVISEDSQGIQFTLKNIQYINDLFNQAGKMLG